MLAFALRICSREAEIFCRASSPGESSVVSQPWKFDLSEGSVNSILQASIADGLIMLSNSKTSAGKHCYSYPFYAGEDHRKVKFTKEF